MDSSDDDVSFLSESAVDLDELREPDTRHFTIKPSPKAAPPKASPKKAFNIACEEHSLELANDMSFQRSSAEPLQRKLEQWKAQLEVVDTHGVKLEEQYHQNSALLDANHNKMLAALDKKQEEAIQSFQQAKDLEIQQYNTSKEKSQNEYIHNKSANEKEQTDLKYIIGYALTASKELKNTLEKQE